MSREHTLNSLVLALNQTLRRAPVLVLGGHFLEGQQMSVIGFAESATLTAQREDWAIDHKGLHFYPRFGKGSAMRVNGATSIDLVFDEEWVREHKLDVIEAVMECNRTVGRRARFLTMVRELKCQGFQNHERVQKYFQELKHEEGE